MTSPLLFIDIPMELLEDIKCPGFTKLIWSFCQTLWRAVDHRFWKEFSQVT